MLGRHVSISAVLAASLALAACTPGARLTAPAPKHGGPGTPINAAATAAPAPGKDPVVTVAAATLTGKVKLLSDAGGLLVSNNGGAVVSNNSGTIISDNGGGVVANNGGNVVANNGSNRRLLATATPRELLLADAVVGVFDAAGKPILDATGKPLVTTTDATGSYHLAATLPAGNLVLRVQLATSGLLKGGELSAIVARPTGAVEQPIDTATTLGTAYVLTKYVQGSQATLDKLPGAEAEKLHADLAAATASLAAAPSYEPTALVTFVEDLRGHAEAVSKTLDEIQALLLGQAHGGDGRPADKVALAVPMGLAFDAGGRLLIGEGRFGSVRAVLPDGTIATRADILRGELKLNFAGLEDFAVAADGSMLVVAGYTVIRATSDGKMSAFAGSSASGVPGPVEVAATATTLNPHRIAVAPDGTVYLAEQRTGLGETAPPRVLAVSSDGKLHQVSVDPTWPPRGSVDGLVVTHDGTLYVLYCDKDGNGAVYRRPAGGTAAKVADGLLCYPGYGGMAIAADGTIDVTENGKVTAIAPNGQHRAIAGPGAPADGAPVHVPDTLLLGPDGTLYVADDWNEVVYAIAGNGSWRVYAGTTSAVQGGDGLSDLALADPRGVAFDAAGALVVAQVSGRELERFASGHVTPFLGDDAPKALGAVGYPSSVAYRDGALYVLDEGNHRILKVDASGQATVIAGNFQSARKSLQPGERADAHDFDLLGQGIAVAPDGRVYWSNSGKRQVYRLDADGMISLVAGQPFVPAAGGAGALTPTEIFATDAGDGGPASSAKLLVPQGLAFDPKGDLYIADMAAMRIRKVTGLDGPNPTIVPGWGASATDALQRLTQGADIDTATDARSTIMFAPSGLAMDAAGNLFVTEIGSVTMPMLVNLTGSDLGAMATALPKRYARVRRITPDGQVSVVAGPGGKFFGDPTAADALVLPLGVAVAPDGRLAIADTGANLVRILPAGSY